MFDMPHLKAALYGSLNSDKDLAREAVLSPRDKLKTKSLPPSCDFASSEGEYSTLYSAGDVDTTLKLTCLEEALSIGIRYRVIVLIL